MLAAPEQENQNPNRQHGEKSAGLDYAGNEQPVFSGDRVVVIAKQKYLIDRRANLSFGSFDQSEPDVARRVLDAVKIARNFSLGREDQDGAGVRELFRIR